MIERLLLVFALSIVTEIFYTCYAYFVSRVELLKAPACAGLIGIFKAIVVIQYVREPRAIATLAVGQVIGTYVALSVLKRRED